MFLVQLLVTCIVKMLSIHDHDGYKIYAAINPIIPAQYPQDIAHIVNIWYAIWLHEWGVAGPNN